MFTFYDFFFFGIGKYVVKIRLGMGLVALGMPPFSEGADSAENPLRRYIHTHRDSYIHTHSDTYIHMQIHTYIHRYIHTHADMYVNTHS
jgi:hypothetical protein